MKKNADKLFHDTFDVERQHNFEKKPLPYYNVSFSEF